MNNQNKKTAGIILCYGIFEDTNLQYKTYLDKALEIALDAQADSIVICGGLTRSKSKVSEAQSVADYYLEQQPDLKEKLLLEERSITTPQNLEFAGDLLQTQQPLLDEIIVICDSIRLPKVYYLALTHLAAAVRVPVTEEGIYLSLLKQSIEKRLDVTKDVAVAFKNIEVRGIWIDRQPSEIGQQIISTMQEIAAEKYPSVENTIVAARKKQWQLIDQD